MDEQNLEALALAATAVSSPRGRSSLSHSAPGSPPAYRISRVVVLHENKLETFVDESQFCTKAATTTTKGPSLCSSVVLTNNNDTDCHNNKNVDDFFDNDSFWSGSITWY
jgi:hypothetical protein